MRSLLLNQDKSTQKTVKKSDVKSALPNWGKGKYTAQRGDTLRKVAVRLGLSLTELQRLNGVANADADIEGRVIRLPINIETPQPTPTPQKSFERCLTKAEDFPAIRGLKLGEEFRTSDYDPVAVILASNDITKGITNYTNVSRSRYTKDEQDYLIVEVITVDRKIVKFKIEYPNVKWGDINEFTHSLSESLPIPTLSWSLASSFAIALCDTIVITADTQPATIEVRVINLDEIISKRKQQVEDEKKQEEERKRKTFKP